MKLRSTALAIAFVLLSSTAQADPPVVRAGPPPATHVAPAPAAPQGPASVSLDHPLPPAAAQARLGDIESAVRAAAAKGDKPPVVVFDIDDTLVATPTKAHPEGAPIPGAVDYVKAIVRAGATVVYLSGRHEGQREKTEGMLQRFGLPLGPRQRLILNASKQPTVDFKADALPQILKLGRPIALFDNEKANARMFRDKLPDSVAVFRLDTRSWMKDPGGTGPIYVIKNFAPSVTSAPN